MTSSATWQSTPGGQAGPLERAGFARIGVYPPMRYAGQRSLLVALSGLFEVEFEAREFGRYESLDAAVFLEGGRERALAASRRGIPCFAVCEGDGAVARFGPGSVWFGSGRGLDSFFRGRRVVDPERQEFTPLVPEAGEEVVASRDCHPLWVQRIEGGAIVDYTALVLPTLAPDGFLHEHFRGERFLRLLPLLNFLKQVTAGKGWCAPPLRACLVFDDPSLHWQSYGCLDYRRLAEHTRIHGYHAGIATVPLDAWWVNRRVAELFRANASHLSLVIHGNNHTRLELVRRRSKADKLAVLAQSLRRVEALEQQLALAIPRVMEPPYGVVTADFLEPMVALGYEATLITAGQFLPVNRHLCWPAWAGLRASEALPGGLGCLPRRKVAPVWKTELLLAAFLGQPIVLAGHHTDSANDLEFPAALADMVNGLGKVCWSNVGTIAKTSYRSRQEGDLFILEACSRRIELDLPEGIHGIRIERPWLADGQKELLSVTCSRTGQTIALPAGPVCDPLPVKGPATIRVESLAAQHLHHHEIAAPPPRLWPFARKALMEMRDQAYPLVHKLSWAPRFLGRNADS